MKPSTTCMITGGCGFLGRRLAQALGKQMRLVVYDISPMPPALAKIPDVQVRNGDIRDSNEIRAAIEEFKPKFIVHLAAITGIATCDKRPRESFDVNVYGTEALVDAIHASEVRPTVILASSREVYGETVGEDTSEDAPLAPNNLYGLTKKFAEDIVRWGSTRYGFSCRIVRFTNLYGPDGDQYVTAAFIRNSLEGQKIRLMGGEQILNLLYVDDAVRSIGAILESKGLRYDTFNIGSYDNLTVRQLALRVTQIVGSPGEFTHLPMRQNETFKFIPNLDRSRRFLGFEPLVSISEGLARTIAHYRTIPIAIA